MVSNIRYPSFKKINLQKQMVKKTLILLIAVASILYLYPVEGFTLMVTLYLLWGVGRTIKTMATRRRPKI